MGREQIDCSFTYEVESGRIMLTSSSCPGLPPNFMFLDATWTVDGDQLQFSDIHSNPNGSATSGSHGRGSPSERTRRQKRTCPLK